MAESKAAQRVLSMTPSEIKVLAREIAREVVAEQRRHELAAYDVAMLSDDQIAKIQRAKMRELKLTRGGKR